MKRLGEAPAQTWEKIVEECPYSTFFHTPAWARIVSKSFPRARASALTFDLNGTTVVLPTTEYGMEGKGFFRAYSSSFLGVYGGPVASRLLSPAELTQILAGLSSARTKRVDLVGNPYADIEPADGDGWTKKKNFTQIVPLEGWADEKELMGRYVHLVRNSVHRAERRGYALKLADSPGEIARYYELYKAAMLRYADNATGRYPLELFLNALHEGPEKAPFWLAMIGDRVVGGVLSFVHNKRWIAWNAAFAGDEFPNGVAKYMHHRLILEAKRRGCLTYDFNPSGGHEGTVKFKEMYGAEKKFFWEVSRSESAAYRAFRRLKGDAIAPEKIDKTAPPTEVTVPTAGEAETFAVAHFRTPYLSITETFIYGVLKHLKKPILPVVFTEQLINTELFPFPRVVDYSLQKKSLGRALNGVANVLFGNNVALLGSRFALNNIRVIHAHFGPQACDLVPISRALGIPLVSTFYGFDMSSGPQRKGWKERYKTLFANGDVFLVEGPHMFKQLVSLGCPSAKVKVQRIGVEVETIPFRERPPRAAGEKTIFLFCGRFIEKKGLIFALQAFQLLIDRGLTNFEFHVMGDGPLMPEINAFLDAHSVKEKVVLLGYRPHVDFLEELQHADVLVAPSVTGEDGNSEGGAPTTVLEAQAAGVPVVAAIHADIPNVVLPGGSALLSPERDIRALAINLQHMLEHPESWASFGRAGRAFVLANHNIATEVARLQEIYLALIQARAPQS